MIAIPFVYFFCWLTYIYRKRGLFSVSTLLIGMYALISLGSILIDWSNAYSSICPKVDIEFYSPIVYCGLLTLCFFPFVNFRDDRIRSIRPCKKTYIINLIVYFYFVLFVVFFILTYKDLVRNIGLIQINENLKADFRFGREDVVSLTGISKVLYDKIRLFTSSSMFLLFFFFYSLCFLRRKWWFYLMILLGSCSCIVDSLLHLDRSAIMYWFMEFLLFGVFFRKFMPEKIKHRIYLILIVLLILGSGYFIYINIARFSNTEIDSDSQMISYIGQSYINFCNFLQNLNLNEHSFVNTLPFINHIIYPNFTGEDWYGLVQLRTGINIMVFSTFLGDIMSGIGFGGVFVYAIIFSIISKLVIQKNSPKIITPHHLFMYFILLDTAYLGLFTTFYHIYAREICAIFLYLILRYADSGRPTTAQNQIYC